MLGDDLAAALPEVQAQAESTMITPCKIRRITGVTPDPETGVDVTTYADVWAGLCKIQERDLQVTSEQIPGGTVPMLRQEVQIPVSAGPVQVGDVVQILDSDGVTVTRQLRISGLHRKTWQTAQRLPVEEL